MAADDFGSLGHGLVQLMERGDGEANAFIQQLQQCIVGPIDELLGGNGDLPVSFFSIALPLDM